MNLNTIKEVKQPRSAEEIVKWSPGYAWLAGGTWLFSTPQIATDTLIDLRSLRWPALAASNTGLDIAATCTIAELYDFKPPADWIAAPLFQLCARAFLASFKIWNAATVGGNICMSLPAGPMVTLATALEARYALLPRDGAPREVAAIDFVTGNHANVLQPGELLRNIHLPARALRKRFASHRSSLTHLGRSAVFLIGTQSADGDDLLLTITAATPRPVQIGFDHAPSAAELRHAMRKLLVDPAKIENSINPPYHVIAWNHFIEMECVEELPLTRCQPTHHVPPPTLIASASPNHASLLPSTTFCNTIPPRDGVIGRRLVDS